MTDEPAESGGWRSFISPTGVILAGLFALVLAIVVPSLNRALGSPGENRALGDMRTLASAEVAFQASHSGLYASVPCLVRPTTCVPSYPRAGPVFLDPVFLETPRGGYEFTFRPAGPPVAQLEEWAYEAVPRPQRGWPRALLPAYCIDSSGRICVTRDGRAPRRHGNQCDFSACDTVFDTNR